MIGPETSCGMMSVRKVTIAALYSRGGSMEFACHRLGPLSPMLELITCEGSCKGMFEQSLMSMRMGVTINSVQRAGFSFTKLELPVDSR